MEIPQEGKYVCKLNGQLVIYEATTGSLCAAVPCVMVETGFTFKHTMVLVKSDGTIQTKTTDTLKGVFGWDGEQMTLGEDPHTTAYWADYQDKLGALAAAYTRDDMARSVAGLTPLFLDLPLLLRRCLDLRHASRCKCTR